MDSIRAKFKILNQKIRNYPLVYLDNAATTQKPHEVVEVMTKYYEEINSNVHRGVHYLSQQATDAHEAARENVRSFLNAEHTHEIIFTKGTTESVNLVASSFGKAFVSEGDEVLVTTMEHHANIVPWQMMCEERKADLKVIPIFDNGELDLSNIDQLLSSKTKILALTQVSNVLGTINPIKEIIKKAHEKNIVVLVDGAQAVSHLRVDVQDLDCDFYCFSAHKMYGPMGIGVLYGKEKYLDVMPPYQFGGEMIKEVAFAKTTFNELPFKFEAGTPAVPEVLGLSQAIKFMGEIGVEKMAAHENALYASAFSQLSEMGGVDFFGVSLNKSAVLSFNLQGIHPYDAGVIIDHLGVAVRTGHHCAQPLMDRFGIPGTIRASFSVYNTMEEVDALIQAVRKAKTMLS